MDTPEHEADYELLAHLRQWRQQRAREDEVPPWVVLTNQLMSEIARLRPDTEDELMNLKGMGPGRMARYGPEILEIVTGGTGPDADRPGPADRPEEAGLRRALPYRVTIEYHLEDDARRRLADELESAKGSLAASLRSALATGPARVVIRIEAERDAA